MAFAERERVARAAIESAKRDGRLALKLIDAVDPPVQAELEVRVPSTREQVENMSLEELRALLEQHGTEPVTPSL